MMAVQWLGFLKQPPFRQLTDFPLYLMSPRPVSMTHGPVQPLPPQRFSCTLYFRSFNQMTICTVLIGFTLLATTGCVQRRLQIRSEPEGAFVSVDRQPVGLSPLSVPYTYYGTREIQLEKDGYKTVRVEQNIRPPWFEWFPISLISNNFAGREIRDNRVFDFTLEPKQSVDGNALFLRADDLRQDVRQGTVTAPIPK